MRTVRCVMTLILLMLTVPGRSEADDTPATRRSLQGLGSIQVSVGVTMDGESDKRLLTSQIQTDAELRLRQNGITLDPASDARIYVRVHVMHIAVQGSTAAGFAFATRVELDRTVLLAGGEIVRADTWNTGHLGVTSERSLKELVRASVLDHIDMFSNAYLAVNPKPR